jgi:hypothetical protein
LSKMAIARANGLSERSGGRIVEALP